MFSVVSDVMVSDWLATIFHCLSIATSSTIAEQRPDKPQHSTTPAQLCGWVTIDLSLSIPVFLLHPSTYSNTVNWWSSESCLSETSVNGKCSNWQIQFFSPGCNYLVLPTVICCRLHCLCPCDNQQNVLLRTFQEFDDKVSVLYAPYSYHHRLNSL